MTFVSLFLNWPLLQCIEMQQYISQTLVVPKNLKSLYRPHSRETVTPYRFLWDTFKDHQWKSYVLLTRRYYHKSTIVESQLLRHFM